MAEKHVHHYLFIAGAWHGGWVWKTLVDKLRQHGHQATALTLTGVGERLHNATADTDLNTHIEDVLAHLTLEDLHNVTLVGWSYGGMVVSGVASRMPERIRSLIYLDAAFPEAGKSLADYLSQGARDALQELERQALPLPPRPLAAFGMTDPQQVAWLTPRITTQPVKTFTQPLREVSLPDVPIGYVYCTGYGAENNTFTATWQRVRHDPNIRALTLESNHFMMLAEPEKTLELLLELA